VDDYVIGEASELRRKYAPYAALLRSPPTNVTILRSRYEVLVTDFSGWLRTLLDGLAPSYDPLTLAHLHRVLLRKHAAAFAPNGAHKRSVAPGRFASEVSTRTVEQLRMEHGDWWATIGY